MDHFQFISTALRDKNVGAIAPTSFVGVRATCRRIDCKRPVTIVEYGPGTGVFTRHLVQRLHPDSFLLAIEMNEEFCDQLRNWWDRRRRRWGPTLVVERGDARNVREMLAEHGKAKADYVISGIPFSFMDEPTREEIVKNTHDALGPGGRFIVYQYSFLVRRYLDRFDEVKLRRVLLNLPPLCVMDALKR